MEDVHRTIELMDLGDAVVETKQTWPQAPIVPDAVFGWSWPTFMLD